jgi:hypothetical protein
MNNELDITWKEDVAWLNVVSTHFLEGMKKPRKSENSQYRDPQPLLNTSQNKHLMRQLGLCTM